MTDSNTYGFFRKVPAIVVLPDSTQLGVSSQQPALLTVHASGYVTAHHQVNGQITEAFSSKIVGPWSPVPGASAGLIPTEAGEIQYSQGPGCACGSRTKSYQAKDPALA